MNTLQRFLLSTGVLLASFLVLRRNEPSASNQAKPGLKSKKPKRNRVVRTVDNDYFPQQPDRIGAVAAIENLTLRNNLMLNTKKEELTLVDISNNFLIDNQVPNVEFSNDNIVYVDTPALLHNMIVKIQSSEETKVIGVDIEHSSDSFLGFICLIQISTTWGTDYLIDAVALQSEIREKLPKIFHDKHILKVFYSAESDIFWLSRDFGISVVNFCDIKVIAAHLDKKFDNSLPNLITTYCGYSLDKSIKKQMQCSDWAQRPLQQQQLNYAALDSHFLPFLWAVLCKKLIPSFKDVGGLELFFRNMQAHCITEARPLKPTTPEQIFHEFEQLFNEEFKKSGKKLDQINKPLVFSRFYALVTFTEKLARKYDVNKEILFPKRPLMQLVLADNPVSKELISAVTIDMFKVMENYFEDVVIESIRSIIIPGFLYCCNEVTDEKEAGELFEKARINKPSKVSSVSKEERRAIIQKKMSTQQPVYENVSLIAPDGEVLCKCDRKKAMWYVERNLGKVINENPLAVQLTFEPNGRRFTEMSDKDNQYYVASKLNRCVVCGNEHQYMKYHIIPILYRENFPNEYKSHRSHDVVLLCPRCHERASSEADKRKAAIAKEYDIPLHLPTLEQKIRSQIEAVRKAIPAFLKKGDEIPEDRKRKMLQEIQQDIDWLYSQPEFVEKFEKFDYKKDSKGDMIITPEFSEYWIKVEKNKNSIKKTSNKDFRSLHGKLVVEKVGDLNAFIKSWRQFFIDSMNPRYLSESWNVDHQFSRSFGDKSIFSQERAGEYAAHLSKNHSSDSKHEENKKEDENN